jgi:flagellar motor protein MotB
MLQRAFVVAVASFAFVLSACASKQTRQQVESLQAERDALASENQTLQARVQMLQAQNESLTAENRRLRDDLAAARRTPATPTTREITPSGVEVERSSEGVVFRAPSDILFPSGVAELTPRGRTAVSEIARIIKEQYPQGRIRIEGHTDTDPIRRTRAIFHCNWHLGFQRAHSVMHALIEEAGFPEERFVLASFGPFSPRDPNDKGKNRRVEITVRR